MTDGHPLDDRMKKAFAFYYDEVRKAMVLKPLNPDLLFPFYIDYPAGIYQIKKTAAEKLQMVK